jgi:hypothetical protein
MFYAPVVRETWQELDGATVHSRHPDTDPERVQLRREATMLGLAQHPAVVEVVVADEDGGRLVTRVGAHTTLAQGPRPGSRSWLSALAGATQTVADLHALGLVHGHLRADRIWVDDRGHAVLDGFERAGLAGECVDGGPPSRPSSDVAALAAMAALGWSRDDATRRSGGGRRSGHRARGPNRVTGPGPELAAVLAAGRASGWPPARRLAHALDAELARTAEPAPALDPAPEATSEPDSESDPFARLRPKDTPTPPRRSRRPSVLAVSLALIGVVALGWGATRVAARASRPSLAPPPAPILTIAGTSYRIGRPGDQVEVGRWGCGHIRAVVLRPGTGEVFAFDGWARSGHDLTARVVAHVSRGSRLVATPEPSGCDGLSATAPGGAGVDLDRPVTR